MHCFEYAPLLEFKVPDNTVHAASHAISKSHRVSTLILLRATAHATPKKIVFSTSAMLQHCVQQLNRESIHLQQRV